jgi:hypothetical protein
MKDGWMVAQHTKMKAEWRFPWWHNNIIQATRVKKHEDHKKASFKSAPERSPIAFLSSQIFSLLSSLLQPLTRAPRELRASSCCFRQEKLSTRLRPSIAHTIVSFAVYLYFFFARASDSSIETHKKHIKYNFAFL